MKAARHKRYTVDNNINATHNLLAALVETGIDAHLVHLGTMGVYGYGTHGAPIPEGYLPVQIRGGAGDWVEQEILHPASPGRSEEHTSELQSLMRISYAVFCLKKKKKNHAHITVLAEDRQYLTTSATQSNTDSNN